ncbi:hypothetical protein PV336_16225 [Streptomyces sp. MI02-2A]|uniref:hypothetical protein n=1 Tax=Streptomyces sp. MI02-2A TaxID=3028688 RepID=UPI0029BF622A|nr:hypothetical protein [Streptomyces sp. MI02-2A]MDX3260768.1 hypothetical protein [Streptomyces sp. MI02-2A]
MSVCSYDAPSAQDKVNRLPAGSTDIMIVTVKPGETVKVDQPRTGRVVQRRYTRK